MKKLATDFCISRYGLDVRLVDVQDAEFIVNIRNLSKSKYIHQTSIDIHKQEQWILDYKQREMQGDEYYFIFIRNNERLGTSRVYGVDRENKTLTTGSWVFGPQAASTDAVLANFITRELTFELFPDYRYLFDVMKGNKQVLRFHKMFNPISIGETEDSYLFELNVDEYNKKKENILKLLF